MTLIERIAQAFVDAAATHGGQDPQPLAELGPEGRETLLAGTRGALAYMRDIDERWRFLIDRELGDHLNSEP